MSPPLLGNPSGPRSPALVPLVVAAACEPTWAPTKRFPPLFKTNCGGARMEPAAQPAELSEYEVALVTEAIRYVERQRSGGSDGAESSPGSSGSQPDARRSSDLVNKLAATLRQLSAKKTAATAAQAGASASSASPEPQAPPPPTTSSMAATAGGAGARESFLSLPDLQSEALPLGPSFAAPWGDLAGGFSLGPSGGSGGSGSFRLEDYLATGPPATAESAAAAAINISTTATPAAAAQPAVAAASATSPPAAGSSPPPPFHGFNPLMDGYSWRKRSSRVRATVSLSRSSTRASTTTRSRRISVVTGGEVRVQEVGPQVGGGVGTSVMNYSQGQAIDLSPMLQPKRSSSFHGLSPKQEPDSGPLPQPNSELAQRLAGVAERLDIKDEAPAFTFSVSSVADNPQAYALPELSPLLSKLPMADIGARASMSTSSPLAPPMTMVPTPGSDPYLDFLQSLKPAPETSMAPQPAGFQPPTDPSPLTYWRTGSYGSSSGGAVPTPTAAMPFAPAFPLQGMPPTPTLGNAFEASQTQPTVQPIVTSNEIQQHQVATSAKSFFASGLSVAPSSTFLSPTASSSGTVSLKAAEMVVRDSSWTHLPDASDLSSTGIDSGSSSWEGVDEANSPKQGEQQQGSSKRKVVIDKDEALTAFPSPTSLKKGRLMDEADPDSVNERLVLETICGPDEVLEDGFDWEKKGQSTRKSPRSRSYFRCKQPGCPIRKSVSRLQGDPRVVVTTYEGKHNHGVPKDDQSGASLTEAMPQAETAEAEHQQSST
eukprot:SM000151S01466  [mRNA]  locus=s151:71681:74884:+ [translate_table: standard]